MGKHRNDPVVPSNGGKERAWTVFWWSMTLIVAACWPWRELGWSIVGRMVIGVDANHQLAQLAWIHRALLRGEGPLLSQPLFWPLQNVLVTSELPVVPGLVFGLLRELGAAPVFAWNLTWSAASVGNFAAMWAALRADGVRPAAAALGGLVFFTSAWIGQFGGGIYYESAFGIPLAWYFLSKIRDAGPRPRYTVGLATALLAQLLSCATNAFIALIVLGVRLVLERALWRKRIFARVALALVPSALWGAWWKLVSERAFEALGMGRIDWIWAQVSLRIDLLHFLPVSDPLSWMATPPDMPFIEGFFDVSLVPHPALLLAILAATVFAARDRRRTPQAVPREISPAPYIAAALGGMIVLHLWPVFSIRTYHPQGPAVFFADYVPWVTDVLWLALCVWHYLSRRAGGFVLPPGHPTTTALALLGLAVLLALGPIVFVAGKEIALGPVAVLNEFVPGFKRIRVPAKLLPTGALAMGLLFAYALDRALGRWPRSALVLALWLQFQTGAGLFSRLARNTHDDAGFRSVALAAEACPACSQRALNEIPLPYKWLRENAPGEPLLEMPVGAGDPPLPGEPPLQGHDLVYQFHFALDGIPRVNGTTSWPPPAYSWLIDRMKDFPAPRTLEIIRQWGPEWMLVHGDRFETAVWERVQRALEPAPEGFELVARWGPVWLYRVEPLERPEDFPLPPRVH